MNKSRVFIHKMENGIRRKLNTKSNQESILKSMTPYFKDELKANFTLKIQ